MAQALTIDELTQFLDQVFPQMENDLVIEGLSEDEAIVRLRVSDKHLRPGGTVSGPSMFALADVSMYVMVLARIGREALAVTTNCSIDFMRKPESGKDLVGTCRLLKLGRVLAVGDVFIRSDGDERVVARASLTYSIPPVKS